MKINIYLNFEGNTEEAFNFYRSVFGGEFGMIMRFKDMPQGENPIPKEVENKIMHINLPIGNTILMGTDAIEGFGGKLKSGNNFSIQLETETKEDANNFFKALSEGGNVGMPLEDSFWGAYFGTLTDKFGVQWMVNFWNKK